MKNKMKTLLGVLLALTIAVGLLPGMLSTAHADSYCPYCGYEEYVWNNESGEYDCPDCGNSFLFPSDTPPGHQHAWNYVRYQNTIEAGCCSDDDCPDGYNSDGITLTIHAPSSLVCDGSAKAATLSGYPASAPEGLAARPSITYNPGGSTAPSTPGTYTASFTWGGWTASVTFTLTAPEPTHTHSWSYQANGSTVTATCTGDGDCDYKTNGIALTINAPSSLVCDGNEKAATLSGYPASAPEGLAALPSINYTPGGSTAPTTAGTYGASFTWGGATASVSFTLTQPTPTVQYLCPENHPVTFYVNGWYQCKVCKTLYSVAQLHTAQQTHTHSWSYQANGATVTATCTGDGDCDYKTNGITLTLSAPSSLVCDGNEKAATLSGYPASAPEGLATPSGISYTKGGNASPSAPTEAGTYTASFTWGGANASVNFTLTQPTPTVQYLCPENHPVTFYVNGWYQCKVCKTLYSVGQLHTAQQTHTHSWSYQADGATVTATCTGDGDCDYKTNGIALTINAPSSLVCDGNPKAAAISGSVPEGLGLQEPSGITYTKYGLAFLDAPTEAGTYTASFSWGGKTASVNFTLTRPTPTAQYLCPNNHPVTSTSVSEVYYCSVCQIMYGSDQLHTAQQTHTHSWSYQAIGSTVTASCGQGCDITEGLSITISAPSGTLTYDGNGKAASLSTGYNTTAFPGSYSISYTKNGSPVSGTPTEAGTYTASFTVGTATGSVNYTINKADPTANAPTGLTATYGQTLANVTLSNPQGNTAGTWAWTNSGTSVGNAGRNTFTANFTPDDTANYNGKSNVNVNVTVDKADPIANAPTGLTATYGQSLSGFELSNPNGNTPGTWAWADSAATVGNAGKNAIQANFTPDDAANYNTASADVDVTVQRKDVRVTANSKSKTEGEADPALTATVEGAVGKDRIDYNLFRDQGDQAGEYTIHVIVGNNPNYSVSAVNGTFTIRSLAQAAGDAVVVEKGVASVPEESIDAILATENEGTVSLDMSVRGEEVTEIVLPAALLDKVAEAGDALAITLTEGTLALDAETVAAICKQADGREVYLKLDIVKEEDLNKAQQEAVKDMEVLAMYEAYILVDGQRVEISGDSKATASVKLELAEGQSESDVRVFALNEAGELTEVPVTWEEGEAKFDVDSFSKYVVTCDAA